jgi:hypothetical protein
MKSIQLVYWGGIWVTNIVLVDGADEEDDPSHYLSHFDILL